MNILTQIKKNSKQIIEEKEEKRLIDSYRALGADEERLKLNGNLIREVAELFAELDAIRSLPSVAVNPKNPAQTKETAAGKLRVKLFASYSTGMMKLNKDMISNANEDDNENGLEDFV